MYNGKLSLTNPRGTPFALSNEFQDVYLFREAVVDCTNAQEFMEVANEFYNYGKMRSAYIDSDNNKYTRISFKDGFGNVHYIIAYKDGRDASTLSKYSDEELISELEARGYSVM